MSHWAEIDENNIVLRVTVGDSDDPNNDEGYQWIVDNLGGTWIKTSYNGNIRKNYAGVGHKYDAELDAFIAPKPFDSWILNEETCQWNAPIPHPDDKNSYYWNEETGSWDNQEIFTLIEDLDNIEDDVNPLLNFNDVIES
jgi:hypothetical protein